MRLEKKGGARGPWSRGSLVALPGSREPVVDVDGVVEVDVVEAHAGEDALGEVGDRDETLAA